MDIISGKKILLVLPLENMIAGITDLTQMLFSKEHILLTSSTLAAVLAEVSINIKPCSLAKASPSSFLTSLLASRSLQGKIRKSINSS